MSVAIHAHSKDLPTEPALVAQLLAEGWKSGPPPHLEAFAVAVDKAVSQALRCPACRVKGMEFRPFHQGHHYRAIAACAHCGACEEM